MSTPRALRTLGIFGVVFLAACALRVGEGSNGGTGSTNGPTSPDFGKPPSVSSVGSGGGSSVTVDVASSVASGGGVGGTADVTSSSAEASSSVVTSGSSGSSVASSSAASGGNGCYSDGDTPAVSLDDLKKGYVGSGWLKSMLAVLDRRYDHGFHVLDAMKNDPWLKTDLPKYYSMSTWAGMIEAIDTACHEETHGYDFEKALAIPGKHVYFHGTGQEVVVPKLNFFPRNKILAEVQAGGSVTPSYDSTYLKGSQGELAFIYLADELTAYINGLACVAAVVDHLEQGSSFRDGVASHLYYLEVYLRVARTQYPTLYATWKADPSWQKYVRLAWARGHYWYDRALPYPLLGSKDAPIWARVQDPTNREEIALYTDEDPSVVACSP
ncbi:MAG: hypothetical protein FJ096_08535 [Deltaproteobacteria bacterium]|nr:hypothetical protein [Deltaproteobacteria bacterium]